MKKIFTLLLISFSLVLNSLAQPFVEFELVASGFSSPVEISNAGDTRLFVVEQDGIIKILDSAYNTLSVPFINIDNRVGSLGNEQGLLGLAFHPDYANNGFFYVNYTDNNGDTRISRFKVDSLNPNIGNPNSEAILLTVAQPATNHNAGDLAFGPDGYLYFGLGDGGGGGDQWNNAQNKQQLLGKMLRIDVDNGNPYAIPSDNPYVNDSTVLDEIFAIGMRNPWRISFDQLTGDLWIADVGQGLWEEVDIIFAGPPIALNFGWRCYEGNHSYNTAGCSPQSAYESAIYEYNHSTGQSITGGFVYRGSDFPELYGHYILADYGSGFITTVYDAGISTFQNTSQAAQLGSVTTFGEDINAEVYAVRRNGNIYRVKETCEELRPIINLNGNLLTASFTVSPPAGTTYQWLFNGFPIPAATANSYSATATGIYSLEVSGTNGCVVESDTLNAVFTGIHEATEQNLVEVFPNPFSNNTKVSFLEEGNYEIQLYNIEGKLSRTASIKNSNLYILNKENLESGTYLLNIIGDVEHKSLLIIN